MKNVSINNLAPDIRDAYLQYIKAHTEIKKLKKAEQKASEILKNYMQESRVQTIFDNDKSIVMYWGYSYERFNSAKFVQAHPEFRTAEFLETITIGNRLYIK